MVTAGNGLGNQLLYMLSAAVLATHLRESSCSGGPHLCDIYLQPFFMYGKVMPRLREWLPGIDAAAAPCTIRYPFPPTLSGNEAKRRLQPGSL